MELLPDLTQREASAMEFIQIRALRAQFGCAADRRQRQHGPIICELFGFSAMATRTQVRRVKFSATLYAATKRSEELAPLRASRLLGTGEPTERRAEYFVV